MAVLDAAPTGVQTHAANSVLFRLPLVWARAVVLSQTVEFTINDQSHRIDAGKPLPITLISNGSRKAVTAFCTPLSAAGRRANLGWLVGNLGNSLLRASSDGQNCLIDTDEDGRLDHALRVNDGNTAAMRRPIDPVDYVVRERVPVTEGAAERDGYVSLTLQRAGRVRTELAIVRDGRNLRFDSLSGGGLAESRRRQFGNGSDLPASHTVFGVNFRLDAFDADSRSIRVTWPDNQGARLMPVPWIEDATLFYY